MRDELDDEIGTPSADVLDWTTLDDLGPRYERESHSSYLRALLEGIQSGDVRNLALSGPYGAGKSSILEGLRQRYPDQTIQVSLSTVRPAEGADGDQRDLPSTADLQKEIVKQILYVVDPSKTPASRFPRTSKFRWGRATRWAVLAGAAGVAVQWLITLVVALAEHDAGLSWKPSVYIPTFIGASLLVLLLLRLTNGRVSISDLSAGPAKLTLSDKTGSYFDDYLDEIVYFFQASKKRILVLEDMDRFNNVDVFEDLRALNVLLNHSAQLQAKHVYGADRWWGKPTRRSPKKDAGALDLASLRDLDAPPAGFHDGPIIFVYAIRDSLLVETVKATNDAHHDAFTRTKFFDLIVPVVPFVTEQNARGALKKELARLAGDVSDEETLPNPESWDRPSNALVRSIAQYFPDQRQIRNIRNEFAIYRDRLLQPGKHPDELTPDRLLALVLYKNLYVADFELIRLGTSKLHRVWKLSQALVTENLERISTRLSHPSAEAQKALSRDLAEHLTKRASVLGIRFQEPLPSLRGYKNLSADDLASPDRWRAVAAGQSLYYNDGSSLRRDEIETAFDVSLDFVDAPAAVLSDERRGQLMTEREVLEQATWLKLWQSPQFVLSSESTAWKEADRPSGAQSFAQIVGAILGEGLASELIVSGHLTQNFALLSAHFDAEFLSIEALNFASSVMELHGRRPLVYVSDDAIGEVLAEHSETVLERSGMVNVHVLSYVLRRAPEQSRRILGQLRSWTDEDQVFLRDFFTRFGGELPIEPLVAAIGYFTTIAPDVISFLVSDASVPDDRRLTLFDGALRSVDGWELPAAVSVNETVQRYAQAVHPSLESLAEKGAGALAAAKTLIALRTTIIDLAPLFATARELFVAQGLFEMSIANLGVIVGDAQVQWVSLERLRKFPAAYGAVLDRIDDYLALGEPDESMNPEVNDTLTADTADGLVSVLSDVTELGLQPEKAGELLRTIARRTVPSLRVEEMQPLVGVLQEALLLEDRATHNVSNLLARRASASGITPGIAAAICRDSQPEIDVDIDLSSFVADLLKATREFAEALTPAVMSDFLQHTSTQSEVSGESLLAAAPAVVVRLIDDGWGDREELRVIATTEHDWRVREALISGTPVPTVNLVRELLNPDDTAAFLASAIISAGVRNYAHLLLDTLLSGAQARSNAAAIAQYLQRENVGVSLAAVHQLAEAGAPRTSLLALLVMEPALAEFRSSIMPTLRVLGGAYASIVARDVGRPPTFAPTPEHVAFLAVLAEAGIVRRRAPGRDGKLRITRIAKR